MATTRGACGSVADCGCPYINFHASPHDADTYRQAHPPRDQEVNVMAATNTNLPAVRQRKMIGPLGTTARIVVGALLLGSVVQGHLARGFHPSAWALGLVGFPALLVGLQWLPARRTPRRLEATGPIGHALNLAVFLVLYLLEPTSDAALIFYGASMWLAALRGYAGCEVLAASNWLLRRDDQIGCALFWPVDQLERHRTAQLHGRRAPQAEPGDDDNR
jgi:hypothetical protein